MLDPLHDEQEMLAAWPHAPLFPDFIVVAAGWVSLEIDGQVIGANETNILPDSGDVLDDEQARIGDYVALFLLRLLDATALMRDEYVRRMHIVRFVDNPACLALMRAGACVRVSYRAGRLEPDIAAARVLEYEFRHAVVDAADIYVQDLLRLNPALSGHPDVAALREAIELCL